MGDIKAINKYIKVILLLLLFVLSSIFLTSCGESDSDTDGKLKIVVTIGMIGDVVEKIGGERVTVSTLMGSGIDPHLYKAKEGDVSLMYNADLIIYNGLHLESKMGEVLEQINKRNVTTIPIAESISNDKLIKTDEEGLYDPHVWMDVSLWRVVADRTHKILIEADPEGKSSYDNNYQNYKNKLIELEGYIKEQINKIPQKQRVLITAHDAFNYFGKAYGIKVKAIQGISTESEASASSIKSLADYIAKNKIPAIFVETSVPQKTIEALKEAVESRGYDVSIGGELFSDAMGTKGTAEGNYIGMIKHNINTIAHSLNKSSN